ncbi:MAG: exopolysaccharide biosynthesis protein [Pseudotabrizicola sp.]|uniref:exopolysaccharide biosynthesis protein n=1 Tax=Pseudotabrizicola sp. TaxID=2939647 RepID=UPI002726629D|nr:exopolysaccharide biosynthesis protein [Pseudotabrizicola sp.]MDO9637731.1 exopolysaccharide biosynthesis protein [Pseudotabrizicola sp.]
MPIMRKDQWPKANAGPDAKRSRDGTGPAEPPVSDLNGIVSRLHKAARMEARVPLGDLVDAMGPSSMAAVLLVPALLLMSPLSGVPGASIVGGLVIALVSAQILLSRPKVWLPGFIRNRRLPGRALRRALVWLRKPARRFDRLAPARPGGGAHVWWTPALALLCLCLGMAMPMLELIPFTSSIAATLVAAFAMTMLTGRVRIALVAIVLAGCAIWAVLWLL